MVGGGEVGGWPFLVFLTQKRLLSCVAAGKGDLLGNTGDKLCNSAAIKINWAIFTFRPGGDRFSGGQFLSV